MSKKQESRYRNYATIGYPESLAENWLDILTELCIPCFISPLHDNDVNPDGESKKPHYHIMFRFDVPKSYEQVEEITKQICSVGVKVITSPRGYARYLLHLDNPEKAQYSRDLIITLGGADYDETCSISSDKYKALDEILSFVRCHEISSYAYLVDYCRVERFDWFRCLCDSGTYVVKEYIKSKEWEKEHGDSQGLPEPLKRQREFLDTDVNNLDSL